MRVHCTSCLNAAGQILDCTAVDCICPVAAYQSNIPQQNPGNEAKNLFKKLQWEQFPRKGSFILFHDTSDSRPEQLSINKN
jgi:hypothetical protein